MNAAPALPVRLALLCRLVVRQGGEWTPRRVERAYADHGVDAPKRTTHRADLKTLHRQGVLNLRTQPGRHYYVPAGHQTTPEGDGMSIITTFRAPGTGRRQADPLARVTAANQRLGGRVAELEALREADGRYIGDLLRALQSERDAHAQTRNERDTAVRSNRSNMNAETVKTDVSALRASIADVLPEEHKAEPQYRPYRRIVRPLIKVVPLWHSPQAAHPARVPGLAELASAR